MEQTSWLASVLLALSVVISLGFTYRIIIRRSAVGVSLAWIVIVLNLSLVRCPDLSSLWGTQTGRTTCPSSQTTGRAQRAMARRVDGASDHDTLVCIPLQ